MESMLWPQLCDLRPSALQLDQQARKWGMGSDSDPDQI